jgi:hypothetical protein
VKTFYSLEDIETLVAQGVRELIVDEDSVLTDVAQDAAAHLGLKLLPKGQAAAALVQPLPVPVAPLGARPRGCQHGPLEGHGPLEEAGFPAARGQASAAPAPKAGRPAATSGGLVDDLVGAVKQMARGTSSSEGRGSAR